MSARKVAPSWATAVRAATAEKIALLDRLITVASADPSAAGREMSARFTAERAELVDSLADPTWPA